MSDEEILRHCKKILKENSYISVAYQIKNVLKIKPEVPLVRRIRAKLLENPEYVETTELEQEGGYKRIRRIKLSPKEKYPFIHDVSVALVGGIIGAVATWLLTPKPSQQDHQAIQRIDSTVTAVTNQVDSIKSLPIFQDTAINK